MTIALNSLSGKLHISVSLGFFPGFYLVLSCGHSSLCCNFFLLFVFVSMN